MVRRTASRGCGCVGRNGVCPHSRVSCACSFSARLWVDGIVLGVVVGRVVLLADGWAEGQACVLPVSDSERGRKVGGTKLGRHFDGGEVW